MGGKHTNRWKDLRAKSFQIELSLRLELSSMKKLQILVNETCFERFQSQHYMCRNSFTGGSTAPLPMPSALLLHLVLGASGREFVPVLENGCFAPIDVARGRARRCCHPTFQTDWCWDETFTFERCCQDRHWFLHFFFFG